MLKARKRCRVPRDNRYQYRAHVECQKIMEEKRSKFLSTKGKPTARVPEESEKIAAIFLILTLGSKSSYK